MPPVPSAPLLLSFDIGTRHLAYCALALAPVAGALTEAPTVKRWSVVDLLAVEGTPYTEAATHVCLKSWTAKQLRAWLDARGLSSVGKRTELQARVTKHLLESAGQRTSTPWMFHTDHSGRSEADCGSDDEVEDELLGCETEKVMHVCMCAFYRGRIDRHTLLSIAVYAIIL